MRGDGPLQVLCENASKKKAAMSEHAGDKASKKDEANRKLSVERIYQKKTQLEHILLRPDTYIGSVEPVTQPMWVYDGEDVGMVQREVTFVPGLYKIFDEILVNAADNKQRCKTMDTIKVKIDPENNNVEIYNNGKGIPIVVHKVEKMYVPSLIFGHLLTSSNYNDEEKKVTGGRNGYGAKLCNIFSTKFVVETSCKDSGKVFKQMWRNNMTVAEDAVIKPSHGEDFTRISFKPDLSKFGMTTLDRDIVAIMSRRAYDVAGSTRGVRVFLNGTKLPVKGFKEYVELHLKGKEDEQGLPLKVAFETVNDRWEVAATTSEKGFQQVSFVNSIATTKGGRHVDHVVDQIVHKVVDVVKKKTTKSTGVNIKPFQVKNHVWVFVNCLIENPTFDSQTKENMTLQLKNFGSKCTLPDKFISQVQKGGLLDSVMTWVLFKTQTQMNKKCSSRQMSKLKGLPKLEDANNAGTKSGVNCTLILTEGDSAKSLAVSGLGVIGRDNYGVFPLRGKFLNVREATAKQIIENVELNNIIKIMGLQYKKNYQSVSDLSSLRYGRLMIMTDQDHDGSHIKGLLINFIHHNWPGLLRIPFLEEFITPIVKVKKGSQSLSFYSMPEFEEWKQRTSDWNKWTTKYYKGLGTSTSVEAREYFQDMQRHRIRFKYNGPSDDNAVQLAFSKKMVDERKEWLTNGMEERKQRRELGLPELYLYNKNTSQVSYEDFVNKELILFSNMDNERSIPSLVDGLKPGQRKVMFTCFKRNLKKEIKVAQLAGSVSEQSAYHHGEVSLMSTIITLAQNFVGTNNLNLLLPIGQFGTRLQGGKDAASPRYIFTKLSPLARHVFNNLDENVINFQCEDNQRIEPEWYIPIIPMVLVNGADGIGTGWMTRILNFDVREIVSNLKLLIRGEEPKRMMPSFKNYKGAILELGPQRFISSGEIAVLNECTVEITELPIRVWTQTYKESVLEPMLHGTDKVPAIINDYKEYHTDVTVRFVVSMSEEKLAKAEEEGLHRFFKLQSSFSHTSMVLFNHGGCLRRYDTVEEILKEFFTLRLEYYVKRKAYMEGSLQAEALSLDNQARFILEKIDGTLVLENKKRDAIIKELIDHKYDPDPLRQWKMKQDKQRVMEEEMETSSGDESTDEKDSKVAVKDKSGNSELKSDFNYLMALNMWNLSMERKERLLKQRDAKKAELEALKKRSPSSLWLEDLDAFLAELDRFEAQERLEALAGAANAAKKSGAARAKKSVGDEFLPSRNSRRIEPIIDAELRKKTEKAAEANIKKELKKKGENVGGDFEGSASEEEVRPLLERIQSSKEPAKAKKAGGMKQSKLNFQAGPKKEAKKPSKVSGSDSESGAMFGSGGDVPAPKERGPRRAAAAKAESYKFNSDSENSLPSATSSDDDDDDFVVSDTKSMPKKQVTKPAVSKAKQPVALCDGDDSPVKAKKQLVAVDSDSDSFSEPPARNNVNSSESQSLLFDSLLDGSEGANTPAAAAGASVTSKKRFAISSDDGSDSDIMEVNGNLDETVPPSPPPQPPAKEKKAVKRSAPAAAPKKRARKKVAEDSGSNSDGRPKQKKAARKTSKKKAHSSDSGEDAFDLPSKKDSKTVDESFGDYPRARSARSRAPIKYDFGEDSADSDY